MKTLTKDNRSLYLFEDLEPITITAENIVVGNPPKLIIGDCNASNTVLHENVIAPDDWAGCKYLFDGLAWTISPSWVEPI